MNRLDAHNPQQECNPRHSSYQIATVSLTVIPPSEWLYLQQALLAPSWQQADFFQTTPKCRKESPVFQCFPNYSSHYQHLILHVVFHPKNPRIFDKNCWVGERVPRNFKETLIKSFVNVLPKTCEDCKNSAKDIWKRERLKKNACKTFPKCSQFWDAKICWNIKTFP